MSAIQRRTTDGEEGMNRAMGYLEQAGLYARSLPNEFFVEKALVHLRLGQRAEARTALETYQEQEPYLPASSEQESALQWWVRNMLEKVERM